MKSDKHGLYNCKFEVGFLSYEMAAGRDTVSGSVVAAEFEDIDFIYDEAWEEKIIKNRNILNINKPKEASYYIYFILISAIEEHIKEDINELQILSDTDNHSKNMWVKRIELSANGSPIRINISGKKYTNSFDVRTTDIDKEEFILDCEEEIKKVQSGLKLYTKRLNGLMYTIQLIKNDKITNETARNNRMLGA